MPKGVSLVLMSVLIVPAHAQGQTIANSFEELRRVLKEGQTVTVTDETGTTMRGTVGGLSQNTFVVLTSSFERKTFDDRPLRAVAKADGVRDGILWGALAGVGAAAIATAACRGCEQSLVFGFAAAGTVPGGIGAGLIMDLIHREEEIHVDYTRRASARSVVITPAFWGQARGMSLAMRW